ncbi:iduronate sulfatase [Sporocytophaga myxococcoides]|uniref:Iduronate sulfatase n=1 Tax=Sporocytophaga myxococcoides TaxID=153721 RepID=A0A098L8B9_9BACT|nr:YqaE/Pmp3 family membrane protein [Sporocytophaga myxococcoides]GAL82930.1 iduronate sulfatase [Sporocytophaga myxococcoides]
MVKYVIAFFLPWLSLMFQKKMVPGIICLVLQVTVIGWLPAFIWALLSLLKEEGKL